MRRWNGWGDDANSMELPKSAGSFLRALIGDALPLADASLQSVCEQVPESRLPDHPLIDKSQEQRVRHATGQSLPDWLALRSGKLSVFPDGVSFPENNQDVRDLLALAKTDDLELIPYGGGTSVAGHVTPKASSRAILTVDMGRMNQLLDLDEQSQIATFGAGTPGPMVEAQLRAKGYTLGHFPQSFELSTIGGWVASRSSGQQSLRYGRIEQLFAGGELETFGGTLDLPTFPASSAGPDLREIILGCEGRFGILTQVKVRVTRIAEQENFYVTFFPNWEAASSFCRDAAQQKITLSMLRVSNAVETRTQLKLAGHESVIGLLEKYLSKRSCGDNKCMLTYGITGSKGQNRATSRQINRLSRQYKGISTGTMLGKRWQGNRFKLPYLREALWLRGYAIDTLETATDWKNVNRLQNEVEGALREGLADENELVHVFTHLSHVYSQGCSLYTSYLYRCADTYEATHARWQKLKGLASQAIVDNHGTISHQHGVGKDHAPYLAKEKGELGMAVLSNLCQHFDPDKQLNPGTLLED
ncbi:MAG: alkyldihydroxyacetonephosphate synthase [Alteromonadaceae bacterium]|jgi:alkyldihydroxyacetonephosphate synthase